MSFEWPEDVKIYEARLSEVLIGIKLELPVAEAEELIEWLLARPQRNMTDAQYMYFMAFVRKLTEAAKKAAIHEATE